MTDCFILPSDFIIGEGSLEPCPAIPTKPDYNTRWLERSTTYHLPNVTFSFEATYPNPNGTDINFGFNIKWQRLPYTLRYTQRYMAYCVVAAVSPDFSNVIAKGDIVLRINEENLFYHHGEEIPDEEVLAKKLEGRKLSTATLRFLRIASNSTNAMVSPSEIQLFSQEKNTTAKFTLKPSKDSPTRMVLESTNIETSTPQPVRRMMQTNNALKPSWMSIPVFKEGPVDARLGLGRSIQINQSSTSTQSNLSNLLGANASGIIVPTYSVHESQSLDKIKMDASEVYRDKTKFVAVFADTVTPNEEADEPLVGSLSRKEQLIQERKQSRKRSVTMLYNIGRYDNEDEARKNIQRAQAAAELYQTFDPYYFIKEVTKKTAPIITIPTAAAAQGPTILTINTSAVPSAAAINRSNTTGAAPSSTAAPLN